jgi:chemotaxis protein histidine kinase CheA
VATEIGMSTQNGNEDLIADYLGEASDYIERLNALLLELSEADGPWPADKVNELFRSAHSLKGIALNLGAMELGELCKKAQDEPNVSVDVKGELLEKITSEYRLVQQFLKDLSQNSVKNQK